MNFLKLKEENDELKAHVERLREAALKMDEESVWHGDYLCLHFDKDGMDKVLKETPSQSLRHIRSQVEEETIERCIAFANSNWDIVFGDVYDLETLLCKYKEQSDEN